MHRSVLVREVLEGLNLKSGAVVVDGTLGSAGHTVEIAKVVGREGRVISLDRDPDSLKRCESILKEYPWISMHLENFSRIDKVLEILNLSKIDAVLLDVGFSQNQIEDENRGFSFESEGRLDMRMGPDARQTAEEIVNEMPEEKLAEIFWKYGEERRSRQYAKAICEVRKKKTIMTTTDLIEAMKNALPYGMRKSGGRPQQNRRHFATRVFQALRIAVNDELENLSDALPAFWSRLSPKGRMAVISFHSLEDRIVKRQFRAWTDAKEGKLVWKKPRTATWEERKENPRARSAKIRAIERL